MHTVLTLQFAIDVYARKFQCDTLIPASSAADSSTVVTVQSVLFRPANIHTHQHGCPVLSIGAASTSVNAQDYIGVIVWAAEAKLALQCFVLFFDRSKRLIQFSLKRTIV